MLLTHYSVQINDNSNNISVNMSILNTRGGFKLAA